MKRRRFLRLTGYAFGAGVLGLGGALAWIQPRRHRLAARAPDDARRPLYPTPRRPDGSGGTVVVIGGGLGGLSAALELQARRFQVTLVERAPALGGKLGGWSVDALGERFPVEHGFHGFFAQYYNLRELLAAAGADAELQPSPGYPVLFADHAPELFGRTTKLFPFNLASVVRQSHTLRFADFRDDGPALYELMRYDGERTFARFDGVDFARFARDGRINRPMVETVLAPFGKTTLNRLSRLSAAEAIRFFHFYFMGNPEGLGFSFTRRDSMSAVVEPLARRFVSLGGTLVTGVAARRLERAGGRVARIILDDASSGSGAEPVRLAAAEVPARGYRAWPRPDGSALWIGRRGDELVALDGRCTHMGCPVRYDAGDDRFHCPCHGGLFDGAGRPLAGPPQRALTRLPVVHDGATLTIGRTTTAATGRALTCDHCVVACEVRGVQALLAASDFLGEPALRAGVGALGEADPYVVWRLWLDRPIAPGRQPFYTTSRYRYTDSLALYSEFQEPFIAWARRTRGAVVEVHAYAIAPEELAPEATIRAVMWQELVSMLPELGGARILHEVFQQQANFTRWAPGDHAARPGTETPLPNLFFAGDWVRLEVPAALMEAATISGRMAANGVLRAEGLREVPISTVAPRGPLVL